MLSNWHELIDMKLTCFMIGLFFSIGGVFYIPLYVGGFVAGLLKQGLNDLIGKDETLSEEVVWMWAGATSAVLLGFIIF